MSGCRHFNDSGKSPETQRQLAWHRTLTSSATDRPNSITQAAWSSSRRSSPGLGRCGRIGGRTAGCGESNRKIRGPLTLAGRRCGGRFSGCSIPDLLLASCQSPLTFRRTSEAYRTPPEPATRTVCQFPRDSETMLCWRRWRSLGLSANFGGSIDFAEPRQFENHS